jgi:glycosyltransferase involved in cell wall biosynthesis
MQLGILASHPIQYQAPWFRALAKVADVEVFFAHRQSSSEQGKAGFGVAFDWDVDLLSGYTHRFLKNISRQPGVNHFSGCDTPEIEGLIRGQRAAPPHRLDAFIVHGWYLKSYLQAARACRRAGVPVLVRGDSQLRTPRSALKRLAMELRQRWLLRQFDAFLTVGRRNREYLEHFGAHPEKIFPAPHFVDNEWFGGKAEMARKQRAEIRREWGADEGTFVALFVGKFVPKKRPADLLRAISTFNFQLSTFNFVAVFVGSGELENELRAIAVREKLRVHFAGFRNQSKLPACYAAADVLVLPSDGGETWGLVVNEAMACGLPAIVSDAVGCAPDLIDEGKTGFTFPLGDVVALRERLAALAKLKAARHDFTPDLTVKMREYSLTAAVSGTLQAVEKLAKPRK